MFKGILLLGIFIVITTNGISQVLSHGDTLSKMELAEVLGYTKAKLRPSDLAGKAIILDFWSTSCSSCLKAFPKIASLQAELGDHLQFILVNRESADSTKRFFTKRDKIKPPPVPMITGDSILIKRFGIRGFPHTVWLDSNGVVAHSTLAYNLTRENVTEFLQGGSPRMKEGITKWRHGSALSEGVDGLNGVELRYYSYVSKCIDGLLFYGSDRASIDSKRNVARISKRCASIVELFKVAYSEGTLHRFPFKNSVKLELSQPELYQRPLDQGKMDAWSVENAYSYDLQLPPEKLDQCYMVMKDDLRRAFNISAHVEKRFTKGIVLSTIGNTSALKTSGGKLVNKLYSTDSVLYLVNGTIRHLNEMLEYWCREKLDMPFRSEFVYDDCIDIRLTTEGFKKPSVEAINKELKPYGLQLEEKLMEIDVLVLSKQN